MIAFAETYGGGKNLDDHNDDSEADSDAVPSEWLCCPTFGPEDLSVNEG
jgi:hypothetical protein